MTRVGIGYDIHQLGGSNRLVLGGVEFAGEPGLLGHSDADVVLHAIIDAILGAAALGDIGEHFPPGDKRWQGADSRYLLQLVVDLVAPGYELVNIDLTVIAERPNIGTSRLSMRESIADIAGIPTSAVSVKATTNERLGPVGRGEGIACIAVALLEEVK